METGVKALYGVQRDRLIRALGKTTRGSWSLPAGPTQGMLEARTQP